MVGYPAFKEWQAIVGALEAGEQILILRKGGIAEGADGFAVRARRFWLFPTNFHAQRNKTKAGAHRHFDDNVITNPASIRLTSFAELVESHFVEDWNAVTRLDAHHAWTEETVQERFSGSEPPGLHVLIVRVFRIRNSVTLPLTATMGGCRSWITVPQSFDEGEAEPVLDDFSFASRLNALRTCLGGSSLT